MAFAKIIDSEKFGQVLLTIKEDDGLFELAHTIEMEGVYVDIKLKVRDGNKADNYFEKFDEETADTLFASQLNDIM